MAAVAVLCAWSLWPARVDAAPDAAARASADALLFDLGRIVSFREQRGWTIDRYALEGLMPDALLSVCACTPEVRALAATEADRRVLAAGGPVEKVWRPGKTRLSDISGLLSASRVQQLLVMAREAAPRDCPFWLPPVQGFRGRHLDDGHLTLNIEGGGLGTLQSQSSELRGGGGGAGRISLARGLSPRWALRGGLELGGGALADSSLQVTNVGAEVFASLPLGLRRVAVSWMADVEAAAVVNGLPGRDVLRYGFRVGALGGLTYLRVLDVLPWGGFGLSYEFIFGRHGLPNMWSVRAGFRFGLDWRLTD